MRNKKFLTYLYSLIFIFFLFGCEKEKLGESNNSILLYDYLANSNARTTDSKKTDSDDEMVLGKKLENPYSLKNMEKAFNSLKGKGLKINLDKIQSNYFYVRLLPKTDDEYNLINSDPSIDTYEYPLDYEILKQGNKFRDKAVGNNKFTWVYCAIPKTKKFDQKIKMEIIDELFLPFGNGIEPETDLERKEGGSLKAIEEESMILTGNKKNSNKNGRIADWYASGRIRVWDDRLNYNFSTNTYQAGAGYVPVPQCDVRANRWFTTKSILTDDSGNFFINHGWGNGDEVNYSIKWERADFDIRSGNYGQAYYNGPTILYQWNLDINETETPDNYMYAHVHRAANIYYYKNTYGVISPPKSNVFNLNRIHLGTNTGSNRSHYFAFNSAWSAAEVRLIFNLSNDDSRGIFSTTIHELTHAAHWTLGMSYGAYCTNAGQAARLAESWAQMVGWYITKQIYGPAGLNFTLNDEDALQSRTYTTMSANGNCISNNAPWYTPLFIDLVDNYNQNSWSSTYPIDNTNGYTLQQLQTFLILRPTNWYMYRDYLKDNSSNPTENAAVQMFSDYD